MIETDVINKLKNKNFFFETTHKSIKGVLEELNFGPITNEYILITLEFSLEPLATGKVEFRNISINDRENNTETYSIGSWKIITREPSGQNSLEIGKFIFLSYTFDAYIIELINNTGDPIAILDLEFDLNLSNLEIFMAATNDFNSYPDSKGVKLPVRDQGSGSYTIPPHEIRTLFKEYDEVHSCFVLKEKRDPELELSNRLLIHFIEIDKFVKDSDFMLSFEKWLFFPTTKVSRKILWNK